MAKLDPSMIAWIVREKKKGTRNRVIAESMGVSIRWVQALWARHKKTGEVPVLGSPGRPRRQITEDEVAEVAGVHCEHGVGAVRMEDILAERGVYIPHNAIHRILGVLGLSRKEPRKAKKRSWVRYERTYSNSMWHVDWKLLDNKKWLVAYEDDASRLIMAHGVFANATSANTVLVLRRAIRKYGRPASILSDRGTQFYATESDMKRKGATLFERTLVDLGIRHILARVAHPQTNGKLERFYGEVQRKLPHFDGDVDRLVNWWNTLHHHSSLNQAEFETPELAYRRKMASKGTVRDEQSGEVYVYDGRNMRGVN